MSSTPISLNLGLATTNTLVKKRYIIIHLLIIFLSALPTTYIAFFWLWLFLPTGNVVPPGNAMTWVFFLTLPLSVLFWWFLFVISTMVVARIFLSIANLFHKPREGLFDRDPKDKDYRYWSLRATIRKFAIWVAHTFPFTYLDVLAFKMLGVKVKGFGTAVMDVYLDTEFVEIGKDTILGLDCKVLSSIIVQDKLLIKRVKIGNNCLVGGASVVSPGTVMEDDSVLGALSCTKVDQVLETGWIYFGIPCRKFKENKRLRRLDYKTREVDKYDKEYTEEAEKATHNILGEPESASPDREPKDTEVQ